MKQKSKRLLGRGAILGLILLAVFQIVAEISFAKNNLNTIYSLEPLAFIFAGAFEIMTFLIMGPALATYYHRSQVNISTPRAIIQALAGAGIGRLVPFGEYLVFRRLDTRRGIDKSVSAHYTIALYVVAGLSLFTLLLVSQIYTLSTIRSNNPGVFIYSVAIFVLAVALIGIALNFIRKHPRFRRKAAAATSKYLGTKTFSALAILRAAKYNRHDYAELFIATLLSWICEATVLHLMLQQFGQEVPFLLSVFGYVFMRTVEAIPLLPGGIGEHEASGTFFFVAFQFGGFKVLAAIIAFRIFSFWLPLLFGGLAYVIGSRWKPPSPFLKIS